MQPKFNAKAGKREIASALMYLPYEETRIEVDVRHITHVEYEPVTDRKGNGTGESVIRIYLGKNYTYAKMSEDLFRAMLRKARQGHDVDYRSFAPETPERAYTAGPARFY